MKKQTPQDLIQKYLSGKATTGEKVMLESWYLLHSENMRDNMPEPDYDLLGNEMWPVIDTKTTSIKKRFRLWPQIAAAVALITIGIYLYKTSDLIFSRNAETVMKNDIAPGKNTATITLASGEVIKLSDAKTGVLINMTKLTYSDGSLVQNSSGSHFSDPISVSSPGVQQRIVLSTPRGGTYQVVLPDGTKVWLNAASSVTFPSTFSGLTSRRVELKGEAYFEVAKVMVKDKAGRGKEQSTRMPFIVVSNKQEVEVLGTHFNVNSYADETSVKTTLLEGAVRVVSLDNSKASNPKSKTVNLLPNQQSVLMGENILVKQVDVNDVISWKNGKFVFNNEDIESIMRKIARWYDVDIVYEDENIKQQTFSGGVSRFNNVSKLLKKIQMTNTVHFKIEGRRISVME